MGPSLSELLRFWPQARMGLSSGSWEGVRGRGVGEGASWGEVLRGEQDGRPLGRVRTVRRPRSGLQQAEANKGSLAPLELKI